MKMPLPIITTHNIHFDCELDRPDAGVLADTRKIVDTGDRYTAIHNFLVGCIKSIDEISDRVAIKSLVRNMPYRSAEYLSIQAMLLIDPRDEIEGYYPCPVCKAVYRAEVRMDGDEVVYDTRDRIRDLAVTFGDGDTIAVDLSEKVEMLNTSTGEVVSAMESFEMDQPTLKHCISAYQKQGGQDEMRLQMQIYVEAMKKVDGRDIDNSWRNLYGLPLFLRMKSMQDMRKIAQAVSQYGMDTRVTRTCRECGKVWKAVVNTSNFFAFEVEPM